MRETPGIKEERKYVVAILLGNAVLVFLGLAFFRDDLAFWIGFVPLMILGDIFFVIRHHCDNCGARVDSIDHPCPRCGELPRKRRG